MGRVLVACEFSGRVRDAFIRQGHDATSCDLLPSDSNLGPHVQGDVLPLLDNNYDLLIAHPPCTYLCNSGVQHLHKDATRWAKMEAAKEFFLRLLDCTAPRIAVENPIPHHYAALPKYSQIIHPWWFGEEAQKKTCLWLKGLPLLVPTNIVGKGEQYVGKDGKPNGSKWYQLPPSKDHQLPPSKDRWKYRSITFQGIADAMAAQWGPLI